MGTDDGGNPLLADLEDSTSLLLQMLIVSTASVAVGVLVTRRLMPEMLIGTGGIASFFNLVIYAFFGFLIVVPVGFAYKLANARR